jgi:hypothetical protein
MCYAIDVHHGHIGNDRKNRLFGEVILADPDVRQVEMLVREGKGTLAGKASGKSASKAEEKSDTSTIDTERRGVFSLILRDLTLGLIHHNAYGVKAIELKDVVESMAAQEADAESRCQVFGGLLHIACFGSKPMKPGCSSECPIMASDSVDPVRGAIARTSAGSVDMALGTQYSIVQRDDMPAAPVGRIFPAVRDLLKLANLPLPMRVNVEAIVYGVEIVGPSRTGKMVTRLDIVNDAGSTAKVLNLGALFSSEEVIRGMRVLFFGLNAQEAYNPGEHGGLWLFEGAGYMQVLQRGQPIPAARVEVKLAMKQKKAKD